MFPFITGNPLGRQLTVTDSIVVPDVSFICHGVNLPEIE